MRKRSLSDTVIKRLIPVLQDEGDTPPDRVDQVQCEGSSAKDDKSNSYTDDAGLLKVPDGSERWSRATGRKRALSDTIITKLVPLLQDKRKSQGKVANDGASSKEEQVKRLKGKLRLKLAATDGQISKTVAGGELKRCRSSAGSSAATGNCSEKGHSLRTPSPQESHRSSLAVGLPLPGMDNSKHQDSKPESDDEPCVANGTAALDDDEMTALDILQGLESSWPRRDTESFSFANAVRQWSQNEGQIILDLLIDESPYLLEVIIGALEYGLGAAL